MPEVFAEIYAAAASVQDRYVHYMEDNQLTFKICLFPFGKWGASPASLVKIKNQNEFYGDFHPNMQLDPK